MCQSEKFNRFVLIVSNDSIHHFFFTCYFCHISALPSIGMKRLIQLKTICAYVNPFSCHAALSPLPFNSSKYISNGSDNTQKYQNTILGKTFQILFAFYLNANFHFNVLRNFAYLFSSVSSFFHSHFFFRFFSQLYEVFLN